MAVPFFVVLFLQATGWCNSTASDRARLASRSSIPMGEREQAYEELLQNCPNEPNLYIEYASLLIAGHAYSPALGWIAKGLAIAPENDDLRLKEAIVLHALGDPEGSLAMVKSSMAVDSQMY